jgi:hypothetical protein
MSELKNRIPVTSVYFKMARTRCCQSLCMQLLLFPSPRSSCILSNSHPERGGLPLDLELLSVLPGRDVARISKPLSYLLEWFDSFLAQPKAIFKVFENEVLRKTFGSKREEIQGSWRQLTSLGIVCYL